MLKILQRIAHDCLTSADGETYAVGRVLGIILFAFGLSAPTAVAVFMMATQKPGMADWVSFIGAMTGYIPMLMAAVSGLIWVTDKTEPLVNAEALK